MQGGNLLNNNQLAATLPYSHCYEALYKTTNTCQIKQKLQ